MTDRRHFLIRFAGLSATVAGAAGLAACTKETPSFRGVDITGADYARGFALKDHDGRLRRLEDFRGKVVVVFFGYTQCPDVCPTAMAELAEVKRLLGPEGARLQGVFVTVDPERDTAPLLKELEIALERHELLKIRLPAGDRAERTQLVRQICDSTGAEAVQEIGRVAVVYRAARKPRFVIPEK